MKTSVTMIRKMGEFKVEQRSKDGMFNATILLKQWNKSSGMKKEIKDFLSNAGTKEFLEVLIKEENLNKGNYPYLATRGNKGASWFHPYLFVKFAMWINPTFEYHVVKFVSDELLKQRNDAGDNYLVLSAAGSKLKGYDYIEVAKAMQWIVFGTSGKELRQKATEEQLKELNDLQSKLAFAIDMGFITTYDELIHQMRKIWANKNRKF